MFISTEEKIEREIYYLTKVFCSVVELGSYTKAAGKLDVHPPAISKSVSRLETLLNKKLLNRNTRNLELTEVGSLFYREGIKQLASLSAMLEKVQSSQKEIGGTLRLTATPHVGDHVLTPRMGQFCSMHPSLSLDLIYTNEVMRLPSQNIDIALRSTRSLEDSTLISRKLFDSKRVTVASPCFIERHGKPTRVDSLPNYPCLTFRHESALNTWKYRQGKNIRHVNTTPLVECSSYNSIKSLCLQGLGIARLFDNHVTQELASGKLIQLLPHVDWEHQSVYAVYMERATNSPKVRAFFNYFSQLD